MNLKLFDNISSLGTGGIHVANSQLVLFDQSTLTGNAARTAGGGISLNRGAKLSLQAGARLILRGNSSQQEGDLGGAGAIFGFPTGQTNTVELSEQLGKEATVSCEGNTPNNTLGVEVPGCEDE